MPENKQATSGLLDRILEELDASARRRSNRQRLNLAEGRRSTVTRYGPPIRVRSVRDAPVDAPVLG